MIKEQGIIQEIKRRKAIVRIQQTSACAHCRSKDSCDVSKRDMLVEVSNDLQAKEGDYVEISVPEGTVLKLSFLVYIIPVIALLIGAFAGAAVAQPLHIDSALASVLGSGLFMGVSFIVLKRLNTNAESSGKYYPRMIRIVNSARP